MLQLKSLSERILLWVLVGPVFLLATLCVGLIKAPGALGMMLPMTVMFGVFFCWKWKARGFIAALAMLTISSFVFESGNFPGTTLWFSGLVLSLASGLFITSLAFHEVAYIVEKNEEDVARYLEDYLRVEENLKEQDEIFQKEKRSFSEKCEEAETYINAQKEELVSTKTVLTLVKSEVEELNKREIELKQKLLISRKEGSALKEIVIEKEEASVSMAHAIPKVKVQREAFAKVGAQGRANSKGLSQVVMKKMLQTNPTAFRLPALQGRVAGLIASCDQVGTWVSTKDKVTDFQKSANFFRSEVGMPMLKHWAKEMLAKEKQSFLLNDLSHKTEEVQKVWEELASLKKTKDDLESKLSELSEGKSLLREQVKLLEQEAEDNDSWKEQAKKSMDELNQYRTANYQASLIEEPKPDSKKLVLFHKMTGYLSDEVKRLKRNNDLYKQLRKQFEDKTEVLDKTREEMFQLETKLLAKELKEEDGKRAGSHHTAKLENEIVGLIHEQDFMEKEIEHLKDIVSELLTPQAKAS